jgi:methionyl-tRNA formyltransferase
MLLDMRIQSPSGKYDISPGTIVFEDQKMFVKCADGWIQVLKLKMVGRNPTGIVEFLNGHVIGQDRSELMFTTFRKK